MHYGRYHLSKIASYDTGGTQSNVNLRPSASWIIGLFLKHRKLKVNIKEVLSDSIDHDTNDLSDTISGMTIRFAGDAAISNAAGKQSRVSSIRS